MKIIIDVGHPGDFHVFKNLAHLLIKEGVDVLFTTREKEFEIELIRAEGFKYKSFGKKYKGRLGKLWGMVVFDTMMLLTALRFKPDLFISHGSIYASHAAFWLRKKHMALEDTGNMEQILLYRPFADVILTPNVLPQDLGSKQIRYEGYHEIAYLHPDFFEPNPSVYQWLGLKDGEKYAIVRFVSWNASHDVGHAGLSDQDKLKLVKKLSKQMRVFITSEADLPTSLQSYRIKIAPERLHDALHYASIVVSEGATVASEAGVLGTPSIYINTIPISYCQDQEKYGLVYNTSVSKEVFALVDKILKQDREVFRKKRRQLLKEKINVTKYFFKFIAERYQIFTSYLTTLCCSTQLISEYFCH